MLGISLATGGLIACIISIVVGILIFVCPRFLAYVIVAYLIIMGIFAILFAVL